LPPTRARRPWCAWPNGHESAVNKPEHHPYYNCTQSTQARQQESTENGYPLFHNDIKREHHGAASSLMVRWFVRSSNSFRSWPSFARLARAIFKLLHDQAAEIRGRPGS
jgi:hypothetical protein